MVKIRSAGIKDIPFIMRVEHGSFDPEIRETEDVFIKRISTFSEGFLIITIDGEDAGYLCAETWEKVPDSPEAFTLGHDIEEVFRRDGKVLYISSFALLPEFRGKGLAGSILGNILEHFRDDAGTEVFVLMVNEAWKAAHHIYRSLGFEEILRIPGIFRNADGSVTQGIIMTEDGSRLMQAGL